MLLLLVGERVACGFNVGHVGVIIDVMHIVSLSETSDNIFEFLEPSFHLDQFVATSGDFILERQHQRKELRKFGRMWSAR
jgi:hypothetical protein